MFSQKLVTIFLGLVISVLSYQTYALAKLKDQVAEAQIKLGASSALTLSNSGEAPDMVGGC